MHKIQDNNVMLVTISLRKYIPLFIVEGLILLAIIIGFFTIPAEGFTLFELGRNNNLNFTRETYFFLSIPLLLIMLGVTIDRILYIRFFKIILSPRNLEFRYGVLNTTVESVDMHVITDFVKKSGPVDQLLCIADVIIHSEDVRTPLIHFKGLREDDAVATIEYLQNNAANTIVEYLINKKNEETHAHSFSTEDLNDLQILEEKERARNNARKQEKKQGGHHHSPTTREP